MHMEFFKSSQSLDEAAWLALRKRGIGGSDIGSVLGFNPYRGAVELFEEKAGLREAPDLSEKQAVYWGHALESIVAEEFSRRTGFKIQRVNYTLIRDDFMVANIDRAVVNPAIAKTVRPNKAIANDGLALTTDTILEIKTAGARSANLWGDSQEAEIIAGNVFSDHQIPDSYELQVQWYMAVTGARVCYVAVLIGGQDFRCYRVDRDDALIATMIERARTFWFDHVLKKVPPQPTTGRDAEILAPRDDGSSIEASNEIAAVYGDLRALKAQAADLKTAIAEKEDKLKAFMCDAAYLRLGDRVCATWKTSSRTAFDQAAFKDADPDLFKKFTRQQDVRRFVLK